MSDLADRQRSAPNKSEDLFPCAQALSPLRHIHTAWRLKNNGTPHAADESSRKGFVRAAKMDRLS